MKNKELDFKFSFKNLLIFLILALCLLKMNLVYSRFFEDKRGTYQYLMCTKPKKTWEVVLEKKRVKYEH